MFGSIMPEPLATIVITALPVAQEIAFGCVSVVIMPSAPTSGSLCRSPAMPTRPRSIFSMGKGTPITPVELMRISSSGTPRALPAAAAIRSALRMPSAPVPTLLTLLFTTMPRSRPARMRSRPMITGAPAMRLRVNTAAAAAGAWLKNTVRSLPVSLSPQLRDAHTKPRGKRGVSSNAISMDLELVSSRVRPSVPPRKFLGIRGPLHPAWPRGYGGSLRSRSSSK